MSDSIQFIKDSCHLHKLEEEYKEFDKITQAKYEELRKWRSYLCFTYPQYRKDF